MTRFYLRAAYAAVLMASMSFAGHAADFSSNDQIDVDDFGEKGVIYGDNVNINASSGPAVSLTGSSSALETYSLQSSPGGSITIVGPRNGVSVNNSGKTLYIGADTTQKVEISSSESDTKNGVTSDLVLAKKGSLFVAGKNISISGVLNKNDDNDGSTAIYGVRVSDDLWPSDSSVVIGTESTESIRIDVKSDRRAVGLMVNIHGEASLEAQDIQIGMRVQKMDLIDRPC